MGTQTDLLTQILDYANRANPYPLYAELARRRCCVPRRGGTSSAPTGRSRR